MSICLTDLYTMYWVKNSIVFNIRKLFVKYFTTASYFSELTCTINVQSTTLNN